MPDDYPTEYDIKGLDSWPQKLINRLRGIRSLFTATAARMGADGVLYPAVERVLWRRETQLLSVANPALTAGIIVGIPGWLGVPPEEVDQFELWLYPMYSLPGNSAVGDGALFTIRDVTPTSIITQTATAVGTWQASYPGLPKVVVFHIPAGAGRLNYEPVPVPGGGETDLMYITVEAYRIIPARR